MNNHQCTTTCNLSCVDWTIVRPTKLAWDRLDNVIMRRIKAHPEPHPTQSHLVKNSKSWAVGRTNPVVFHLLTHNISICAKLYVCHNTEPQKQIAVHTFNSFIMQV